MSHMIKGCRPCTLSVFISLFVFIDGLTHWSLTGSTMTDEDTFMGFSDGLSQSGIPHNYCLLEI